MRLSTQLISRLAPAKTTSPSVSKVTKTHKTLTRFAAGAPELVPVGASAEPRVWGIDGCRRDHGRGGRPRVLGNTEDQLPMRGPQSDHQMGVFRRQQLARFRSKRPWRWVWLRCTVCGVPYRGYRNSHYCNWRPCRWIGALRHRRARQRGRRAAQRCVWCVGDPS